MEIIELTVFRQLKKSYFKSTILLKEVWDTEHKAEPCTPYQVHYHIVLPRF